MRSELLDLERGAALGVPAGGAHGAPGALGRRRIGVHGALGVPGELVGHWECTEYRSS